MFKSTQLLIVPVFLLLAVTSHAQTNAYSTKTSTGKHASPSNSVKVSVTRQEHDVVTASLTFAGDTRAAKSKPTEISTRFLRIDTAADGSKTLEPVGAPSRLSLPAMQIDKNSENGVFAKPTMTLRMVPGAGGLTITVKDMESGSTKEISLPVPSVNGTTTAELKY